MRTLRQEIREEISSYKYPSFSKKTAVRVYLGQAVFILCDRMNCYFGADVIPCANEALGKNDKRTT